MSEEKLKIEVPLPSSPKIPKKLTKYTLNIHTGFRGSTHSIHTREKPLAGDLFAAFWSKKIATSHNVDLFF